MNMIRSCAAIATLACATQVQAAPVTIDFNAYAPGTLITDQYASSGVRFGRTSITQYLVRGFTNGALSSSIEGGTSRTGYIDIFFDAPVSSVTFDYGNYGAMTGGFIQAYGSNDTLLETITYDASSFQNLQRLGFAASNISRIQVTSPGVPSWLVGIDNLSFDSAAADVPEPGSLALLGLGVAGWLANRRRKQA